MLSLIKHSKKINSGGSSKKSGDIKVHESEQGKVTDLNISWH